MIWLIFWTKFQLTNRIAIVVHFILLLSIYLNAFLTTYIMIVFEKNQSHGHNLIHAFK